MTPRLMFDSTQVADLPGDATMVLAYVDGHYATLPAVKLHFPHAQIVTCTVTGRPGANVCDCEQGDLTPAQAASWARLEVAAGRYPTIYCSLANWQTCKNECGALGLRTDQVSWFVAHYDDDPTIPPGAVAKQYKNDPQANLDTSSVAPYWPGVDVPLVPEVATNPPFPGGPVLSMYYQDPVDGSIGFTDPTGTLVTFNNDGTPGGHFLGNLVNHPEYNAGQGKPLGPVVGITWWRDAGDNTQRGFCGYIIWTQDGHGQLHPYRFPSDGSHAGQNQ